MESIGPLHTFLVFGIKLDLTVDLLVQWLIILAVLAACIYFTRDLQLIPTKKRQNAVEMLVVTINNLVKENMGEECMSFVPYIGSVAIFLTLMNLAGLFGVEPPTASYSNALGMGIISFFVVQGYAIKKQGTGHYLSAYAHPYAFMLPLNLIERVMLPVSLSLRLFGNMFAASILVNLIYQALYGIPSFSIAGIKIPIFMTGAPIVAHLYFDIFDGLIQMIVFTMLTMINIKIISEH